MTDEELIAISKQVEQLRSSHDMLLHLANILIAYLNIQHCYLADLEKKIDLHMPQDSEA